ncbi:MAG: histidinol dehydrogenase [Candidatus Ancaeobacter aquaticus]|nr:histidinol dehydrogenase [Candidatus Ancaeobacter aquaticus]
MEIIRYNEEKGREKLNAFLKSGEISADVDSKVKAIIDDVRYYGDKALLDYTSKFDKVFMRPEELKVDEVEFIEALAVVTREFKDAFKEAKDNITEYYSQQKRKQFVCKTKKGKSNKVLFSPIEKVGVYIPGGTAPLVSTILMTVVLAQVAGVKEIVIMTPPSIEKRVNPYILSAAYFLGVKNIYKVGGAQAIAGLAFGTETLPKVDKIVGPGNMYVASAKRQVYGFVGVDLIAGPSEIAILADDKANPAYIAIDLLSQAEHDEMSRCLLVTPSYELAQKVKREMITQARGLSRKEIIEQSLMKNAMIALVENIDEGVEVVNAFAPEHLEIMTRDSDKLAHKIKHAGTILLGDYSPVAVADFIAGASHVLPTGGSARAFSGLSLDDFIKKINVVKYSKSALQSSAQNIIKFTDIEGLDAHGRSVSKRFEKRRRK